MNANHNGGTYWIVAGLEPLPEGGGGGGGRANGPDPGLPWYRRVWGFRVIDWDYILGAPASPAAPATGSGAVGEVKGLVQQVKEVWAFIQDPVGTTRAKAAGSGWGLALLGVGLLAVVVWFWPARPAGRQAAAGKRPGVAA